MYNNDLGHEGSFGSSPVEVISKEPEQESSENLLDFQVMRQMARNLKHNTELSEKNRDAVLAEGAFRTSKYFDKSKVFDKASRITRIRYSEDVRQVDEEEGPYIKDTEGQLHNPKLIKAVPVGSKSVAPPPELKKGTYDNRIEQKKKLWPQARQIHRWLKTLPEGAANITITNKYKDDPSFKAALNPANVSLGFLRMGKDGNKDITKKPVAIVKLFEGWFVRKNPKDQIWFAVGTMPAAFKAKPDVEEQAPAAVAPAAPEPAPEPIPEPRRRLRGKLAPADRPVQRFMDALVRWLGAQPNRTATAAGIMRFLRRQEGFAQFVRQNPLYNRAASIVAENPETFTTVPGGSLRNPRIRLR